MTRVISIGECMVELRARADGGYQRAFAGDAFNMAAYLKRSAPEIEVQFLTGIGSDLLSQSMREAWRREGVGDDLAFEISDAHPGLYMIDVTGAGERSFTYWRSASAARRWFEALKSHDGAERLSGANLIYVSGISLAILPDEQRPLALSLLRAAQAKGARLAFDPNYRVALWTSPTLARQRLQEAADIADFFLPSQDDLSALDLSYPPDSENVTTNGAAGCTIVTRGSQIQLHAPLVEPSAVNDTSGAGDSFSGAYLAARLRGQSPEQAAQVALSIAARVVTAPGALVPANISHPLPQSEL